MKRIVVIAVLLALAGCIPGQVPSTSVVPAAVLPSGPDDIAGARALLDYAATHRLAPGDDDAPDKVCTQMGPPNCINAYGDLWWCQNACGDAYWHLTYTHTCIDVRTGEVIECP